MLAGLTAEVTQQLIERLAQKGRNQQAACNADPRRSKQDSDAHDQSSVVHLQLFTSNSERPVVTKTLSIERVSRVELYLELLVGDGALHDARTAE